MKKITTVTVVTSGYRDRFLFRESHIEDDDVIYRDTESYATYSTERGFESDYTKAWDKANDADSEIIITGKTAPTTTTTIRLTNEDVLSIDAFLKVNYADHGTYTNDAINGWREQLSSHPLPDDVYNIVRWQIAQCDMKNLETWGSVDGQYKRQA